MKLVSSIIGVAFDCTDADALADLYSRLLGLEKTIYGNGWVGIHFVYH